MIKAFRKLVQLLRPPQWGSWQTFICVALGLFLLSLFTADLRREALAIASFASLSIGLTWLGLEQAWIFTPWMTAALALVLIHTLLPFISPSLLMILWPPFAGLLWLTPHCFDVETNTWHTPVTLIRQRFLLIMGVQLLLSCWLQFHFLTQSWLDQYPSLLVDDFQDSFFVAKTIGRDRARPRGVQFLQAISPTVERRLNQQDWRVMADWLNSLSVTHELTEYTQDLLSELNIEPTAEDQFWIFQVRAFPQGDGYDLAWQAQWEGPRSAQARAIDPYLSEMRCAITPTGQMSTATCQAPYVVIRKRTSDSFTDERWWQRLRLWPRGFGRDADDSG